MGRPELAHDERTSRRQFKEALARALAESDPSATSDQIARRASLYLPPDAPLTGAQVNHFRAVGQGNLRAPGSAEVANSLVWALEDLGVFRGRTGRAHRRAVLSALEELGFSPAPRPPINRPPLGARAALRAAERSRLIGSDDDPRRGVDFEEMWVFSRAPSELTRPGYRLDLKEAHLDDPAKTLAYFIPPGDACDELCAVFRQLFGSGFAGDRARVFVVECTAVKLAPHFVIWNPGRRDERGEVRVVDSAGEFRFCALDPTQTSRIVSSVHAAGVGVDRSRFAPADEPGERAAADLGFRLVYASPGQVTRHTNLVVG